MTVIFTIYRSSTASSKQEHSAHASQTQEFNQLQVLAYVTLFHFYSLAHKCKHTYFIYYSANTAAADFEIQARHKTEDSNHLSHLHLVSITCELMP